jgi:hypothetical protein
MRRNSQWDAIAQAAIARKAAIGTDTTGFSRMVSAWRAGFWLEPNGSSTLVSARSVFEPRNVLIRAMLPAIRRRFHRTQRSILAGLKRSLEGEIHA